GNNKTGCVNAGSNWTINDNGQYYAPFFPAHYYLWKDGNGNGVVDPDERGDKIEIKPGKTYEGSSKRTDCVAAPVCTYEEEIQNFANWFSYYRNRDLSAKGAVAAAIADVTGIRVGFATINENSN